DTPWDFSKYDTGTIPTELRMPTLDTLMSPESMDPKDDWDNVLACLEAVTVYQPKSRLPTNPYFDKLRPLFG
ncbi:hypothetical protein, partial [Salmonella enterica]|uniref:hypothetical protein n=1 Tax=Salmonella enterica TaxID=28901 RepID=UPI003523535E